MALTKNTAQTPKFEDPDLDAGTGAELQDQAGEAAAEQAAIRTRAQERLAAGAAQHTAAKPAEDVKPAATREVATQSAAAGQVAVSAPMVDPLEPLKNAFPVEFDTLRSLKISAGNVVDNQTGKPLGDTIGLELLSFQDQWVISPGVDGDEAKEHVRYSDDGKTTTKGEDCDEYLAQLKESGFPEAKSSKRTVICGSLFDIGEKGRKGLTEMQDCLVQISLAPTSKAGFDRYRMDQAFRIRKGILTPAGAERIKVECQPQSKNGKDWTMATFTRYDA